MDAAQRIRVFVTVDVDQDGASSMVPERASTSWEGLRQLPLIHESLSGLGVTYTAFVRADEQIRERFGSHLGILRREHKFMDGLLASGGQIGWHPHLYATQAGSTPRPIHDPDVACTELRRAFDTVGNEPAFRQLVRIGEAWHSTRTMCLLDELGFRVDSTAIPGRFRDDEHLQFDWSTTPNRPYHPSARDYRCEQGSASLRILEVPMTSAPIRTDYDASPLRRYVNLSYQPHLFLEGLRAHLSEANGVSEGVLVVIVHPHEVLEQPENGLYRYGVSALRENLEALVTEVERSGREISFEPLASLLE